MRRTIANIALYAAILAGFWLPLHFLNFVDWFYHSTRQYEQWNLDELLLLVPGTMACLIVALTRRNMALHKETQARLKAEQDANKALALIKKQEDIRTEFMLMASHEIRTPLNMIVGMLEIMFLAAEDPHTVRSSLEDAREAANHLASYIDNIMNFSRLESDFRSMAPSACDLGRMLSQITKTIRIAAENKGLDFTTGIDESLPANITTHCDLLRIALTTLLDNAVKFTEQGSITAVLSHAQNNGQNHLQATITDTGPGIPPDKLDQATQSYTQARNNPLDVHSPGLGLGLSVASRCATLLKGTLTLSNTPTGLQAQLKIPY